MSSYHALQTINLLIFHLSDELLCCVLVCVECDKSFAICVSVLYVCCLFWPLAEITYFFALNGLSQFCFGSNALPFIELR